MNWKCFISRIPRAISVFTVALSLLVLGLAAGAQDDGELTVKHPKVRKVIEVQEAVTPALMAVDDVIGTAVAQDDDGEMTVVIYVNLEGKNPAKTFRELPREIAGVRARPEITDPFRAMLAKPSRSSVSHTAKQTPPIQLGTSGGWGLDLANGYCCGGTIGSLIQVGKTQYILSNYHVFEADIVPGGNGIAAETGNPIIQPGLIDLGCNSAGAQVVGTLVKLSSLPSSNVDCSIAEVVEGMVRTDGAILEIGTISSFSVSASVGQAVKKSGRTTGLTKSKVSGLNATISVMYDNECAGGAAFTKTFKGQIVVANAGSKFLNAGDSGSLMVEDVSKTPKAVGLLYAGSSTTAIANPIGEVLAFVGSKLHQTATMVGK
jgi:hypothetical protein